MTLQVVCRLYMLCVCVLAQKTHNFRSKTIYTQLVGWLVLVGFLFFFFYICVDAHVVVYIWVTSQVGQRCSSLSHYHPSSYTLQKGLSLNLELVCQPTNPSNLLVPHLFLCNTRVACVLSHAQLSMWDFRIWIQVFMLPQASALTYWAIFLVLFQLSKEHQETERKASRKNRGPMKINS